MNIQIPLLRAARTTRSGFTLIELLITMTFIAILMTIGFGAFRNYAQQQLGRRATQAVAWEVTLARSYAIRSGGAIAIVADETARTLVVRDADAKIWHQLDLGPSSDLPVSKLDVLLTGDSLVFSRRGLCLNCLAGQVAKIIVGDAHQDYTLEVSLLGRVEIQRTGS